MDSTGNDIRINSENIRLDLERQPKPNFLKVGSGKLPMYAQNELNISAEKINPQDVSVGMLFVMIDDLGKTMQSQLDEMKEQIANFDDKLSTIRYDMEDDSNSKGASNEEIMNEPNITRREKGKNFKCLKCQSKLFSIHQFRANSQNNHSLQCSNNL